ncbi:hypothetical protein D9M68_575300 [compost metagenome]
MLVSRRNEGRFVGVQQERAVAIGDLRHSAYHCPMLAAMVMHLQRQRSTRLYDDALDLEALAFFQGGVGTPGAVNGAVKQMRIVALLLQLGDDLLDLLAMLLVGNEQCVRRIDDDQVLHPDQRGEAIRAVHVVVVCAVRQDFAFAAVAIGVRAGQFSHRRP